PGQNHPGLAGGIKGAFIKGTRLDKNRTYVRNNRFWLTSVFLIVLISGCMYVIRDVFDLRTLALKTVSS
ncbi:hypothetical protein KAR10_06555, partial [bacterium]|nr:hypothetical protein [bacterium]